MTNKEAIYIINNRLNTYYCTDEDLQALNLAVKSLEERPQGEWLCDDLYSDCRCSICNSYALERGDYPELSQYCPACGAIMVTIKMRGDNNG